MQFKLSPVVALLLLLFTGTALASYGCYSGGQTWGDIGNDDEVNNGLAALCKNLAGSYALHTEHAKCQNVNGHGIHGSILPTEGPRGELGVDISQEACLDVVKQVKDKCSRGGARGRLVSHPDNYGGDWFRANVILDPNSDSC